MDRNLAGLIAAVGAFAVATPSHAATAVLVNVEAAMQASSYADLLKPIPNAVALLQAADVHTAAPDSENAAELMEVQYYRHHHHRYQRRRHFRRHHHHASTFSPAIVKPV